MALTEMGKAGLTGVPGRVARGVSGPIARVTPMSKDHVMAVLGAGITVLTLWRMAKLLRRMWRAREDA